MKQFTLSEYTKIYGFDFYIYDETIDDYLMEEYDTINPDCDEWEHIKDEIIIGIDETLNEKPTLYIATFIEEEKEEREMTKEEWEAYQADIEYHDRKCKLEDIDK